MARLHLFEFNDQPWFPAVLRDGQTGYLETVSRAFGFHERLVPVVERALHDSGADRIVDLCSGSGGPILEIRARLARRPPVVLTDKFPNRAVFESASGDGVTAVMEPVDATRVPERLGGLRTLINAFHHFRPDAARRILADAVACRAPIAIVELSERTIVNIALSPLIVPLTLVFMPLVRPTRWQYWVFSYLIPIIPLTLFWDGFVSHLRTHSREEMRELITTFESASYEWRTERLPAGPGVHATVLVGIPRTSRQGSSETTGSTPSSATPPRPPGSTD